MAKKHKNRKKLYEVCDFTPRAEKAPAEPMLTMFPGAIDATTWSPARPFPFWPTMQPEAEVDAWDLYALWTRARSLYANSSDVRMVVKSVTDLLGYLTPLPNTEDEEWNRLALQAFRRRTVAGLLDASGRLSWRSAAAWLTRRAIIDGDALVVLTRAADGGAQFAYYHAPQVWGDVDGFAHGCKCAPGGRVTHYRLTTPGDKEGRIIPAAAARLYQHEPDPARVRGVSGLISAMNDAQDLKEFDNLTKASLKLAASYALIEKKPPADPHAERQAIIAERARKNMGGDGAEAVAAMPEPTPYQPYSVNGVKAVSLAPGRTMELLHDTRPSNETRAYMHDTKARIAYGLGFDPCLVYFINELGSAGARYSLQRNRRTLAAMRVQMEEMAAWQYRHIIAAEVAAGRLRPCRAADWAACRWVPLSDLTIDKGRDTTAAINLVREGLADADQWTLATDGLPMAEILRRRAATLAEAKQLAEQYGIPLQLLLAGALGATTSAASSPPVPGNPAEEEQEPAGGRRGV